VQLHSPNFIISNAKAGLLGPTNIKEKLGLTPIIEDLAEMYLSSMKKKPKDDSVIYPQRRSLLVEEEKEEKLDDKTGLQLYKLFN